MEERISSTGTMAGIEEIRAFENYYLNPPELNVPVWRKSNLTIEEAAVYSGIGQKKLRRLLDREDCPFVLWNGTRRLIKRKKTG